VGITQCFKVPPIMSGTGKATVFKFGRYIDRGDRWLITKYATHSQGPYEQKPFKILKKRERGTADFLVPPIISGTDKGTNFKFCTHFNTIDRNKSPLTVSGKVSVGVARDSRKFSGHPYIGALRGHLCDSTAFLFYISVGA